MSALSKLYADDGDDDEDEIVGQRITFPDA